MMVYEIFEREELLAARYTDFGSPFDCVFAVGLDDVRLCAELLEHVEEVCLFGINEVEACCDGYCWDTQILLGDTGVLWAMRRPVAIVNKVAVSSGVYGDMVCACGLWVGDCIARDCERGRRAV